MAEPRVIPVSQPHRAIRTDFDVNRAEPAVRGTEEGIFIHRLEGGSIRDALADIDHVLQGIRRDEFPTERVSHQVAVINAEGLGEALAIALRLHVTEVAEGIGIVRGAVFAEVLLATHALLVMHATRGAVGAAEDAALGIDLVAEGIAAAFRIDFEDLRPGMIAPDVLAFELHVLRNLAADIAFGRAAVRTIEPAIGTELKTVRDAVRVLDAKAAQADLGIAIGDVIVIRIGIEEKIRRIHDPDAARALEGGGGDVQTGDDVLVGFVNTIAVLVFEDRDLVRALHAARGRLRHLVIHRAQMLVIAHDLEPGRELILDVLCNPEPTTRVKGHVQRLRNLRLRGDEINGETVTQCEAFQRFLGRCRL